MEEDSLTPKRFIPLEPVHAPNDERVALTDIVIALYLENLSDANDEDGTPVFPSITLVVAVRDAFCLGCAVGIEHPERVPDILRQTHDDNVEGLVEECRLSLLERIEEMKTASEPISSISFIGALTETLEEKPFTDSETAQNAISMSFEYGCILSVANRSAAIVVRNDHNRSQINSGELSEDNLQHPKNVNMSFSNSLQEYAVELIAAYQEDVGFAEDG